MFQLKICKICKCYSNHCKCEKGEPVDSKINKDNCEGECGIGCTCDDTCDCGTINNKDKKMNENVNKELVRDSSFETAKKLINERQLDGNRMGINDDLCNTNLISKNYSPMFIRKFNSSYLGNWPLYISMICDEDVSDIDMVVNGALKAFDEAGLIGNNLQSMRNLTGIISETISKHYNAKKENCVEGISVTLYIDKAYIQNLSGDYMSHFSCRMELTAALNMMTQI